MNMYFLTYFSRKTTEELDSVVIDLYDKLSQEIKNPQRLYTKIANLFIEKFDPDYLIYNYNICVSDKLEKAVKQTLNYPIDTEALITHIYDILDECKGE